MSILFFQLENCLALGGTLEFDEATVNEGAAIADCLVQLVPDLFTTEWRSKIITDTAGNWTLRVSMSDLSAMCSHYLYLSFLSTRT